MSRRPSSIAKALPCGMNVGVKHGCPVRIAGFFHSCIAGHVSTLVWTSVCYLQESLDTLWTLSAVTWNISLSPKMKWEVKARVYSTVGVHHANPWQPVWSPSTASMMLKHRTRSKPDLLLSWGLNSGWPKASALPTVLLLQPQSASVFESKLHIGLHMY